MTTTTTTTTRTGTAAHREHARQRAEAEATRLGPAWRVGGSARGTRNFPSMPPVEAVADLLDDDARLAWDRYSERLGELAGARRAVAEALVRLDASDADDRAAAESAVPASVRPARADAHMRAVRYATVVGDIAERDLAALGAALAPDRSRMVALAWSSLGDEAAKPRRTPGPVLRHVQRVEWCLALADTPAWPPSGAASRAFRSLPYDGWSERVDELLDARGQTVAAELAEPDDEA